MQHACLGTIVIILLTLINITESKVVHGMISTQDSPFPYPQGLTFFCGRQGSMLAIQLNYSRNVICNRCKIYLPTIDDWKKVQARIHGQNKSEQENACRQLLQGANVNVDVVQDSLSQSMITTATLEGNEYTCWYLVYADDTTCISGSTPVGSIKHQIDYTLTLQNKDIDDHTISHFSAEEEGILLFYQRFTFIHFFVMCLVANSAIQVISKAGPMYQAMIQLAFAEISVFLSLILATFHLLQYSSNGIGVPFILYLSNFFAVTSRFFMVRMFCGVSFSSLRGNVFLKPNQENRIATIVILLVFAEEIVIFYNIFYNELHRSIICYYSLGATPLILLRLIAFAIIGFKLSEMISEARGVLKKEFYVRFSLCCMLWLLTPVILSCVAALLCRQYFGIVLLVEGILLLQFCASFLMYRLIMSRSLYWEVSALSASILPTRIGSIHR